MWEQGFTVSSQRMKSGEDGPIHIGGGRMWLDCRWPAVAVVDLEMVVEKHPGDRFAHLYLAEAYRSGEL